MLNSNKGMNLPRAACSIPAITDKDREDLAFAIEQGLDWMALSFVRTSQEVWDLKGYIRQLSAFGRQTPVISKIEKPEAIANIDDIIAASDGIMVARGDLGIELVARGRPDAAEADHRQVQRGRQAGDHRDADARLDDPQPPANPGRSLGRRECDPRRLGRDHAVGRDGIGQVPAAGRPDDGADRAGGRAGAAARRPQAAGMAKAGRTFAEAVSHASVETALDLSAAAIITPTVSGSTARAVSRFRPPCPVVAVTPSPFAQRELVLFWGVYPLLSQRGATTDAVIADAVDAAQANGFVKEGDVLIVTGGSVEGGGGTTNLMKVHLIERVLATGWAWATGK